MANRSSFVPSMLFVIFLSKFVNFRVSFQLELVFNLKYPGNELGTPSCSCLHFQSALNFIQYLSKTGSQVNVTSPLKQSDGVISRADDYWNGQLFRSEFLLQEKRRRASNLFLEQSGIVRTILNFFVAAFIIFVLFVVVQFGSGCGSGNVCCIDLLVKGNGQGPKGV